MGSEEDASETSDIGSMAMSSESGAIDFQATPDSEREVRTECVPGVPPPVGLTHCHSMPAASVVSVCTGVCVTLYQALVNSPWSGICCRSPEEAVQHTSS